MVKEKEINIDSSWKGVIRFGGFSLFAAGVILVIFVTSVFILQQTLPLPAKEVLENPAPPAMLFLIAVLGELLLMPAGLGLFFALKNVKKSTMFIATSIWLVALVMFLVSRGLILSLSQISGRYMTATSETMKAGFLASAEHAIEIQNIYAIMALICLNVASIIIGLVMLKGDFGKRIGYLVVAAGIFTLFTPFGVIMQIPIIIPFIGLVLTAVWQLIVGAKLFKLGKVD